MNFVMKKQRQRKDEIFMEMLARDGVPKKKGLMELLSYLEKRRFRQQLQLLQDNRVEKKFFKCQE